MKEKVKLKKHSELIFHLMLLGPVIVAFIFYYIPMGGIIIAFKEYKPGLGILGSPWVGLKQFKYLLDMPEFYIALRNTLFIAIWKIALGIIMPVAFALLLNEIRCKWFKKTAQTITFIPYFLSWVVLGGDPYGFPLSEWRNAELYSEYGWNRTNLFSG